MAVGPNISEILDALRSENKADAEAELLSAIYKVAKNFDIPEQDISALMTPFFEGLKQGVLELGLPSEVDGPIELVYQVIAEIIRGVRPSFIKTINLIDPGYEDGWQFLQPFFGKFPLAHLNLRFEEDFEDTDVGQTNQIMAKLKKMRSLTSIGIYYFKRLDHKIISSLVFNLLDQPIENLILGNDDPNFEEDENAPLDVQETNALTLDMAIGNLLSGTLLRLSFFNNVLYNAGHFTLSALKQNNFLTYLKICRNDISGAAFKILVETLKNNQSLLTLKIIHSRVAKDEYPEHWRIKQIAKALEGNRTLTNLSLSFHSNLESEVELQAISSTVNLVAKHPSLKEVSLGFFPENSSGSATLARMTLDICSTLLKGSKLLVLKLIFDCEPSNIYSRLATNNQIQSLLQAMRNNHDLNVLGEDFEVKPERSQTQALNVYQNLEKILGRNRIHRVSWQIIALLISSYRANRYTQLQGGCRPLFIEILKLGGASQRCLDTTPFAKSEKQSAFMETRYFKVHKDKLSSLQQLAATPSASATSTRDSVILGDSATAVSKKRAR